MKKYIFINQATRYLFIDILNEFAINGKSTCVLTGEIRKGSIDLNNSVKVKLYKKYNNSSTFNQFISWTIFSSQVFFNLLFNRNTELVFATTPPFTPFFGLFFKRLYKVNYHIIVYDVFPDALINFGYIKQKSLINKWWSKKNYQLFQKASSIITLCDSMSDTIKKYNSNINPIIVYNWVDSGFIKPINKTENWFAKKYAQENKLTILYSGNMGATHNFDSLLEAAKILLVNKNIHFVFIGDGIKRKYIEDYINENGLSNTLLLPLQKSEVLPYSLAMADIGVITLDEGAGNISVPSKTYYMLAAGSAILSIAPRYSELAALIKKYQCGELFVKGQVTEIVSYINKLNTNHELLIEYKKNARKASLDFTPANAKIIFNTIAKQN